MRPARYLIALGLITPRLLLLCAAPLSARSTTTYVFVGIFFVERDLLQLFGQQYGQHKRQVGMLIPRPKSG